MLFKASSKLDWKASNTVYYLNHAFFSKEMLKSRSNAMQIIANHWFLFARGVLQLDFFVGKQTYKLLRL